MFVLYVNKHKKIQHFPGKRHYLLYFDSLGITNPYECMSTVERCVYVIQC